MKKNKNSKWAAALVIVLLLSLCLVVPAQAFQAMSADTLVIESGEVIDDDLYAVAASFTLRGVIKGDLVVLGSEITIASGGVVEGDIIAAGQNIVIKGTVIDDLRTVAAAITIETGAEIGDDLVAASYSLETEPESSIGGDLAFAGGQSLLAGEPVDPRIMRKSTAAILTEAMAGK